ncbi:hypothetical protein OP10G_4494 [Fimbriimonas ginsengisoli Gsoil 348]|uniref:PIN domain-containing protein n=2 Tax=Fimbriimonas ginsengisoli TaxID=1005039 RepID=A0A068NWW5_FIMGI|nr:hypothetical protein OP10G_4494 [Fimbriimonas ginsengisoli Gsoil 348]
MREVLSGVQVLPLLPKDYAAALEEAEAKDCRGGTVYDLLHLQAALSWGATKLVTLNPKHFRRLISPGSVEIVEP